VTENHVTWPKVTGRDLEVMSFDGSRLQVAVDGPKLPYTVHFTSYKAVARRRRQLRDRKWRHVTSGDRKWLASDVIWRKSHGSGWSPKTRVYCTFHFLQGCNLQWEAVTWREITSRDLRWLASDVIWPEFTRNGCRRPITHIYCTFHFLKRCSRQEEAVTWQEITWPYFKWPEVTRKWRNLTGSHQEVAVEGKNLQYTLLFTSYKAVARSRQSRDFRWP